ncbi:uncharacterized protein SAPINGB_P004093 [Magnusiomyces paraingens]|uniref:Ribosome biogenesis protein ALB1 n=1 Tax=Magnusiomyces paraingens TaxID=2606893 RepID=A0A5E8BSQ6_9ASCO|nr:uncharacterized protein SAPINGB_P004093 [Saprochaete ingens]VVT54473.1 unnamed protein product [Saprochaete ingens]
MPDLINKATHLKQNAHKAKSFARKVQRRRAQAARASQLSATVKPSSKGSSTALVVRTTTSVATGLSSKTISKKKQIKRDRNARYQNKAAAAVAAAIHAELSGEMQIDGEQQEMSSTQRKAKARREANARAREQALALAAVLAGDNSAAVLEGEMEIETNGSGTTLGRPRQF